MALLVSSSVVWADEITIADGTGTTGYVPIYGMYADAVHHTQSIYPASMLEDLPVGCTITKLTYYLSGLTDANLTSTFVFKLGETSSESFASAAFDNSPTTVVFTGNVVTTSNPVVIEFDEPYIYNGGNLLIDESNVAAGNWKTTNFYAISHTGGSVYKQGSGSATSCAYLPKVTIEYSGGQVATCHRVKNVAAVPATNSALVSWTSEGTESQWVVAYKTASDTEWTEMTVNTPSATISGLNPQTVYNVKVKAVCTPGTDESAYSSEITFKTAYVAPYFEDFSTTGASLPADWSKLSGAAFGASNPTTTTSGWSTTTNGLGTNHYKMNIYSTNKYWLVTPNIYLDNRDFNLVFKLAATGYNSGNPTVPGSDDEFIVIVSTDDGATWTEANATKWGTGDGYDYQFSEVSNTGDEITVPLSAYKNGTVKIAFYGASYQSNADFDVHVGDVSIEVASSCAKVTGLNVAGITSTSANVDWTPMGSESSWVVAYCAEGETTWTELSASAHPFTISGLNPNSPYKVKVKAVCSLTEESGYTSEKSFRTACSAFTTLPYVCGFESEELEEGNSSYKLPQCWSRVTDNTSSSLYPYSYSTSYSHTGSRALYYSLSSSTYQVAVMGEIDTTAIAVNALRMKFFARMGSSSYSGAIKVGAMTDPADYTSFTELGTVQISSTTMTQFTVLLSDYTPDMGSYLALAVDLQSLSSSYASIYVDDLTLEVAPSCVEVDGEANITDIDEKSAVVNISDATATDWQVAYGTVADPEQCEIKDANGQSFTITGLDSRTTYYVYVRRNCGSEFSAWSTVKSFTTTNTAVNAPFVCGFESIDETNVWESHQATGNNALVIGSAAAAVKDGSSALYVSNDGSTFTYGTSVACASYYYVTMRFEEKVYNVSFDWQCTGGENNYDYASVMLLDATTDLTALTGNTFPAGIETFISKKSKVGNNSNPWNTYSGELDMHGRAGVYKFVVAWCNDGSGGTTNYPFAIDNISIIANNCPKPEVSVSQVTDSQIRLSATHDVARSFEYVVATSSNFDPDDTSDSTIISRSNKTTVRNLMPNTVYYYTGRALCDDTTYSEWADIQSVRTLCELKTLPYTETFEDANIYCWSNFNGVAPSTSSYTKRSGDKAASVYSSNMVSPEIDVTAMSQCMLDGYAYSSSANAQFVVGVATDPTNDSTFVALDTVTLTAASQWLPFTQFFTSLSGTSADAAKHYVLKTLGYNSVYFDDLAFMVVPSCMKPTSFVASNPTDSSVELAWIENGNATNWLVVADAEDGTHIEVVAQTNPYVLSGLQAQTVYTVKVAALCSAADTSDFSNEISFKTLCIPLLESPLFEEGFESITQDGVAPDCWSMGWIVKPSDNTKSYPFCSTFTHYNGSRGFQLVDQTVGSISYLSTQKMVIDEADKYMVHIAVNRVSSTKPEEGIQLWLTTSQNDTTDGVKLAHIRRAYQYAPVENASGWYEYEYPITVAGQYHLTIIGISEYGNATSFDDLSIVLIPSCLKPADVVCSDVTENSVNVSWTERANATQWAVKVEQNGQVVNTLISESTNITVSGLTANTAYQVSVAAVCGGTDTSEYTIPVQFRTACGTITLPYNEDFESYPTSTVMPCWDNSASSTPTVSSTPYYVWGVYSQSGSNTMRMYNYSVQNGTAVINTPSIVIPATGAIMTFDYASDATCGSWFVQVSSDGGDNFTNMAEFGSTSSSMLSNEAEIDLSAYANQNIIVRFFANANWGYGAIYVDNIAIVAAPSCHKVSAEIASVTASSADVTVSEICAWQIAYGVHGTAVEDMPIVSVPMGQLTYSLTQLTEVTAYDLYVRRDCGSEQGEWSDLVQFRTAAVPIQLPYITSFEDAADNQKWLMADGAGTNVFTIGNDPNAVNGGDKALYVTDGNSYSYTVNSSSRSFAYRTLEFEAKRYIVSFDWQCTGGESTYDYGRVMLYPASAEIVGGAGIQYSSASYPQGMIPFDPDYSGKINLATEGWHHYEGEIDMTERTGIYNFVALWNNDGSMGTQSPLAIDNLSITEAQTSFLVTFVDYDGQVLSSDTMEYGSMPVIPELPGRPATAEWEYVFSRWSPYISSVTADVTYTAVYDSVRRQYPITWMNYDGTVIDSEMVAYGYTPAAPSAYRPATAEYTYIFTGWNPSVAVVTGAAVYTAMFDSVVNTYNVVWSNWDASVLAVDTVAYGVMPVYAGATPVRESTDDYSYSFTGWSPMPEIVTADAYYVAQFEEYVTDCSAPVVTYSVENGNSVLLTWNSPARSFDYFFSATEVENPDAQWLYQTSDNYLVKTNVPVNTMRYLYVRANCGLGTYSDWTMVPFFVPCAPVENLKVKSVTTNTATIAWTNYSGTAQEWVVVVSHEGVEVGREYVTTTTYTAQGLNASEDYTFTVYPYVNNMLGTESSVEGRTLDVCDNPVFVGATQVSNTKSMRIEWTSEASSFDYFFTRTLVQNPDAEWPSTTTEHSLLKENMPYNTVMYLYVRANCGENNYSGWEHQEFMLIAPAVENLKVKSVTTNTATIAWTNYSGTAQEWVVVVSHEGVEVGREYVTTTTYTAQGLNASEDYTFTVYPYVNNMLGTESSVEGRTLDVCDNPVFVGATQVSNTKSMRIEWTSEASSFDYFFTRTLVQNPDAEWPSTTTEHSLLKENMPYNTVMYLYVRANCGENNYSGWEHQEFMLIAPAVENLKVKSVTTNTATIAWTNYSGTAQEWVVVVSHEGVEVGREYVTTTTYTAQGLNASEDYTFTVYPYVNNMLGTESSVEGRTLDVCDNPVFVGATQVSNTKSMRIEWTSEASSFDYFFTRTLVQNPDAEWPSTTTEHSLVKENMPYNTKMYLYVRANCGDNNHSGWEYQEFMLASPAVENLKVKSVTTTTAFIAWTNYTSPETEWVVVVSCGGSEVKRETVQTTRPTIEDLAPDMEYTFTVYPWYNNNLGTPASVTGRTLPLTPSPSSVEMEGEDDNIETISEQTVEPIEVFVNHGMLTIENIEENAVVMISDAAGKMIYNERPASDRIEYALPVKGVYMVIVRGTEVQTVKTVY